MSVIHLEVDEAFAELLGSSPEQIERSALEMIVLELYRRHEISAAVLPRSSGSIYSRSSAGPVHSAFRIWI